MGTRLVVPAKLLIVEDCEELQVAEEVAGAAAAEGLAQLLYQLVPGLAQLETMLQAVESLLTDPPPPLPPHEFHQPPPELWPAL